MVADPHLRTYREKILTLASRHGATNVRVFGSVARGTFREDSDIDLLVDLEPGYTLIDLGALLMDLQDLLGRRVEIVTPGALHSAIRDQILREAVPL